MKGAITISDTSRERKGNDFTDLSKRGAVVVIVATFLVILMVELCGELWLRQLSENLFSVRIYSKSNRTFRTAKFDHIASQPSLVPELTILLLLQKNINKLDRKHARYELGWNTCFILKTVFVMVWIAIC